MPDAEKVPTGMTGDATLTALARDGFAIIHDVIPTSEVERVLPALTQDGPRSGRAGRRNALREPVVLDLAEDERLLGIARQVLGPMAQPFRATVFDKTREANWLVTWHQDTTLPLRRREQVEGWGPWSMKKGVHHAQAPAAALEVILALRVHLDDATSRNGPLRVIPRTHRRGILTGEDVKVLARASKAVNCLTRRGGVVAMRPLLIHASSKMQVDGRRRVLHIEYAASLTTLDGLELAVTSRQS